MALPRYRANNTPKPSGSPPSPAPTSGSTGANSSPASQNAGSPVPGVLLGLSGGWLVARMFFFGGTLWLIEIIAISVAAGFVYPKGGKVQKMFATAIIAVALLNLFVPGINPRIKSLRESQLNPPTPTEQSAGQEQITQSPSPIPEIDRGFSRPPSDTTVLKDSGVIILENGDYMVVFSFLGDPKNGDVTYQSILFTFPDGSTQRVNARGKENHPLNWTNGGKVEVVFFPDSEDKTSGHYTYLKNKGEQAELPYLIKVGK